MEFEGAVRHLGFTAKFERFEGDSGFSPWGRPMHSSLRRLLLSRKHTGNHIQQVSPFKLVGVLLLLKSWLVCISRLGVKIGESFELFGSPNGRTMWKHHCLHLVYGWSFRTYLARKYVVL